MMNNPLYALLVGALCLALGTTSIVEAKKAKQDILSKTEVSQIVAKKVGSDVLSITLQKTKIGNPYYQVTVDNTPDDEVKDVYVNAHTGKIVQVTEHPNDMILGEDEEG